MCCFFLNLRSSPEKTKHYGADAEMTSGRKNEADMSVINIFPPISCLASVIFPLIPCRASITKKKLFLQVKNHFDMPAYIYVHKLPTTTFSSMIMN